MEIIVVEKDKVMQLIVAKKTALYANSSIFVCFPLIIDRRLRQNGKLSIMFQTVRLKSFNNHHAGSLNKTFKMVTVSSHLF